MDFQTFAVQELTAIAEKLADTSQRQLEATTAHLTANFEATTAQLTANFEATIERMRHDQAQMTGENERLTAENAALSWEKEQVVESAKADARGPLIARLSDVFDRITASRTFDEAVVAAGHGLIGDFRRVAVFVGDRRIAQLGTEIPAIDPLSASALAFPIDVRGETLATLYVEDPVKTNDEGARLADVIRRHTTLALERLTIELKTVNELRAYAQMLMDEVEYVFNADTTAGVAVTERRERLGENLRCARQIYSQRVTLDGPAAAAVLDEVMLRMLDAKGDTPFGRELADVATAPATAA